MRVKLLLCLVVLCLAAVYVSAETVVVTSRQQARVNGFSDTGGHSMEGPITDAVGYDWIPELGKFRQLQEHVEFDLTPYKDRAGQLLSATLSWRNQSWLWPGTTPGVDGDWFGDGNYVEVDQVPSHGTIAVSDFMWSGNPTMGKIASGLWSSNDQNDVNDRYAYDVTGQASEALQIAGSDQGIHFVWTSNIVDDIHIYNLLNNDAIAEASFDRFYGPNNDIPNPNSVEPILTLEFIGGTKTVNPVLVGGDDYWSYAAAGTNIGVVGTGYAAQQLAAFSMSPEYGENYEWRVSVGFDVQRSSLGLDANDIVFSAILKFDTTNWLYGPRDMVTVDQTQSYLVGPDPCDFMYGYHWATLLANGTPGESFSIDITSAFNTAMNSATPLSGMSFVWYADNDADVDLGNGLVSPYDGSGTVVCNTGYAVENARIEISYTSVPPGSCEEFGTEYFAGDANKDCKVDFADLALMAADWLQCTTPNDTNCSGVWYNQ